MLVTRREGLRRQILDQLLKTSTRYHALWKSTSSETVQDLSAFVTSEGSVEYLGVSFRYCESEQQYLWNHLEKNINRWNYNVVKIEKTKLPTWKNISFLAGVLTWHWTISGEEKKELGIALQISHRLGESDIDDKAWNKPVENPSSWFPLIRTACDRIRALQEGPYKRTLEAVEPFEEIVYLASDASNERGAWVDLIKRTKESGLFNDTDRARHINWKETWWALRALEVTLEHCSERSLIKIGVDNMTAVCALKQRVVGFDSQLDSAMQKLVERYKLKQCKWVVHHIAGDAQPADEPSRGLELNDEKVEQARAYLAHKPDVWFHWAKPCTLKRERIDDVTPQSQITSSEVT